MRTRPYALERQCLRFRGAYVDLGLHISTIVPRAAAAKPWLIATALLCYAPDSNGEAARCA